jgi:hypothetical protein
VAARPPQQAGLDPVARVFYRRAMGALRDAEIPFLVGGAYALARYTGIERHTKDLDLFLTRDDALRALEALGRVGCQTDLTFPHWLAKAFCGDDFIDLIFNSGNGVAEVDDGWFKHGVADQVLGVSVRLCPGEEMIWSKGFIMERERYDGADIAHLLRALGPDLDWSRLLRRFGEHWRVLLSHLVLFGFIYPSERDRIPAGVMRELTSRVEGEAGIPPPDGRLCQGTLLSRAQYLVDVQRRGFEDARRTNGGMTTTDIAHWTAAIDEE